MRLQEGLSPPLEHQEATSPLPGSLMEETEPTDPPCRRESMASVVQVQLLEEPVMMEFPGDVPTATTASTTKTEIPTPGSSGSSWGNDEISPGVPRWCSSG